MEQPICQNVKEAWRLPDQITLATSQGPGVRVDTTRTRDITGETATVA